jgi:hypothetical protein
MKFTSPLVGLAMAFGTLTAAAPVKLPADSTAIAEPVLACMILNENSIAIAQRYPGLAVLPPRSPSARLPPLPPMSPLLLVHSDLVNAPVIWNEIGDLGETRRVTSREETSLMYVKE